MAFMQSDYFSRYPFSQRAYWYRPSCQILIRLHGCVGKRFSNARAENTVALCGSRYPFLNRINPASSHMADNGIEAQNTWRGSAIKQRPPGFSTRYISAIARFGSGKTVNSREAIKMSNSASAQESSSALMRLNEQLVRPKASARSRAHCNWLSERSAPVTEISRNRSANRHE